jgi:ParB family transcriptional regulator, chromosome partitioning protein
MADKPRRLGRGLEALLTPSAPIPAQAPAPTQAADESGFRRIPIAQIRPNPYQPRKDFRPEELAELEASLRASGLIQPITVRSAASGGFELVAGERRLRAATRLGWTEIPAVVTEVDERALLTLALVENLQRADLNPLEEAEGYRRLIDEFQLTQQEVADAVGKDRSTVANTLRILALPAAVRKFVEEGHLTSGHARAILALPNERAMLDLAREAVAKKLTVRDLERRARPADAPARKQSASGASTSASPEVRRITDVLRQHLQTDVSLSADSKNRGQISIAFYSADDLQRLVELLTGTSLDEL